METDRPSPALSLALSELASLLANQLADIANELVKAQGATVWSCLPVASRLDTIRFHVLELRKTVKTQYPEE